MHPLPSYRYPSWQFRSDGQPVDHLAELLGVLRDFGPFQRESGGLRRSTGWGEVEWFRSPHALLDGATPAAMLTTDPTRDCVLLAPISRATLSLVGSRVRADFAREATRATRQQVDCLET